MTPDMITALMQGRAMVTGFFEFDFPSGTRRLMIGGGEVSHDGNIYMGTDETFGTISAGEEIREDTSGQAPNTSITIAIHKDADRSDIAGEAVQLTPVSISFAALTLDDAGHIIAIPDPEGLGDYFIDQPVIGLDTKKDEVDYSLVSSFDYFFEDGEGQRLNGPFHKSMYPGETGLDNVTGVTRRIYWGAYGPGGGGSLGVGSGFGGATGHGIRGFLGGGLVSV